VPGICKTLAFFSCKEFLRWPEPTSCGSSLSGRLAGVRGRRGGVPSCRDPRSGEEVEASDAIEPELPLASRSTGPDSQSPWNVFERRRGQISRLDKAGYAQSAWSHSYYSTVTLKNPAQDGFFWHTTDRDTACRLSWPSCTYTLLTELAVRQLSRCPGKLGQAPERCLPGGSAAVFNRWLARPDSAASPRGAQSREMGDACIICSQ
jgi:hypothetical protein